MGAVRGSDGLVVGFITTYAISDFESHSWRGVLNTTLCDKVCQWFSPGTPVSSTSKTDRHDITEILLKVALKKCRRYFTYEQLLTIELFEKPNFTRNDSDFI